MTSAPTMADAIGSLPHYDPDALHVDDARRLIARMIEPVREIEQVPVRSALGRTLALDVVSPIDVPAHDNSAMDGFAVRHGDLDPAAQTRLRVVGTAYAGRPHAGSVGAGEAVRIMTGAVMPAGADTVVVQELARAEGDQVAVPPGQAPGQHLRRRGEDLAAGRPALAAGRLLTPADLGLAASLGVAELPVRRRLRVAFFSTGNELRSIGEPLPPGHIYDSNRYTIHGMLIRLGVEPIDLGVVRDDPAALEAAMRSASECADAIVSSGGVSVGEADFTREVMARLGDVAFWKIAMRPGRPMAFGRVGGSLYFGLPGNPVAVMVTFLFFVRDALRAMSGARQSAPPPLRARSLVPIRKKPGRTEYQRGIVAVGADGLAEVRLSGSQGSGVLRSMSEANCFVVLHHGQADVAAGEAVDCLPFEGFA